MTTWVDLDEAQQKMLVDAMLQGKSNTAENINRATQALSTNDELLARMLAEAGLEDAAESVDDAEDKDQDPQSRMMAERNEEENATVAEAPANEQVRVPGGGAVAPTGKALGDLSEEEIAVIESMRKSKLMQDGEGHKARIGPYVRDPIEEMFANVE